MLIATLKLIARVLSNSKECEDTSEEAHIRNNPIDDFLVQVTEIVHDYILPLLLSTPPKDYDVFDGDDDDDESVPKLLTMPKSHLEANHDRSMLKCSLLSFLEGYFGKHGHIEVYRFFLFDFFLISCSVPSLAL